jgi:hypothetical protein
MAKRMHSNLRLETMMTLPFPLAYRKIKNPTRLMQQGVWLLLVIAVALLVVLRMSGNLGSGSLWILGCSVVAFLLAVALRDVMRKLGHRNTESKIVHDVKAFLEAQPPVEFRRHLVEAAPISRMESREEERSAPVPSQATCFMPMAGELRHREPGDDLVVFDAIPAHPGIGVRMNFYPVMTPVVCN